MKDDDLNQRAFILSSFSRLRIPLTTSVYRFADNLIKTGWVPPKGLNEVDHYINEAYHKYANNG